MDNNEREFYIHQDKLVPRVSDIIKQVQSSNLLYWAYYLGTRGENFKEATSKDTTLGTIVHSVLDRIYSENYIKLDDDLFDKYEIPRKYESYIKNGVKNALISHSRYEARFRDRCEPEKREYTLTCPDFGGTIDLIVPYNDGYIITDYKTSKDFYPSMFIQLGAYTLLHEFNFPCIPIYGVRVILLDKKNGECARDMFIDRESLNVYISAFKALLDYYNLMRSIENGEKKIQNNGGNK